MFAQLSDLPADLLLVVVGLSSLKDAVILSTVSKRLWTGLSSNKSFWFQLLEQQRHVRAFEIPIWEDITALDVGQLKGIVLRSLRIERALVNNSPPPKLLSETIIDSHAPHRLLFHVPWTDMLITLRLSNDGADSLHCWNRSTGEQICSVLPRIPHIFPANRYFFRLLQACKEGLIFAYWSREMKNFAVVRLLLGARQDQRTRFMHIYAGELRVSEDTGHSIVLTDNAEILIVVSLALELSVSITLRLYGILSGTETYLRTNIIMPGDTALDNVAGMHATLEDQKLIIYVDVKPRNSSLHNEASSPFTAVFVSELQVLDILATMREGDIVNMIRIPGELNVYSAVGASLSTYVDHGRFFRYSSVFMPRLVYAFWRTNAAWELGAEDAPSQDEMSLVVLRWDRRSALKPLRDLRSVEVHLPCSFDEIWSPATVRTSPFCDTATVVVWYSEPPLDTTRKIEVGIVHFPDAGYPGEYDSIYHRLELPCDPPLTEEDIVDVLYDDSQGSFTIGVSRGEKMSLYHLEYDLGSQ